MDTRYAREGRHLHPLALAAGLLLGLGFGGFFDGIVFHQVLQWHHMLSDTAGNPTTTVAGLEDNTLADGLFHIATLVLTVAGVAALWLVSRRDRAPGGRQLLGLVLAGWGIFNIVEGLVNHYILGIHHLREGSNAAAWDAAFLAGSVLLVLVGMIVAYAEPSAREELRGSKPARPQYRGR